MRCSRCSARCSRVAARCWALGSFATAFSRAGWLACCWPSPAGAIVLCPFALLGAQVLQLLALFDPQLLTVLRRQPLGLQCPLLAIAPDPEIRDGSEPAVRVALAAVAFGPSCCARGFAVCPDAAGRAIAVAGCAAAARPDAARRAGVRRRAAVQSAAAVPCAAQDVTCGEERPCVAALTFAVGPPCEEVLPYAAALPFVVEQPSRDAAARGAAAGRGHRRLRGHDVEACAGKLGNIAATAAIPAVRESGFNVEENPHTSPTRVMSSIMALFRSASPTREIAMRRKRPACCLIFIRANQSLPQRMRG